MNITLLAVFIILVAIKCSCETFHIVPDNSTERCEDESCLSLDQLTGEIVDRNITSLCLHFHSGEHYLTQDMDISNVEIFEMVGSTLNSRIWLDEAKLSISEVDVVVLQILTFFSRGPQKYIVSFNECENLTVKGCTFIGTKLQLTSKSATIIHCIFNSILIELFTNNLFISLCEFSGCVVDVFTLDVNVMFQAAINNMRFHQGKGIAIRQENGYIHIMNSEFRETYGGAIEVLKAADIRIINTSFTSNYNYPQRGH